MNIRVAAAVVAASSICIIRTDALAVPLVQEFSFPHVAPLAPAIPMSAEQPEQSEPYEVRLIDNLEKDEPYEAGLKVFCTKTNHGAVCSERCMAQGIGCVPLAVHPYKSDAGIGKLFSCNSLIVGFMCGYHYPNGDDCYYPFGTPFPKVCAYSGND